MFHVAVRLPAGSDELRDSLHLSQHETCEFFDPYTRDPVDLSDDEGSDASPRVGVSTTEVPIVSDFDDCSIHLFRERLSGTDSTTKTQAFSVLPLQRNRLVMMVGVPAPLTPNVLVNVIRKAHGAGLERVRIFKRPVPVQGRNFEATRTSNSFDFYSALLVFESQTSADEFYQKNHGRPFATLAESWYESGGVGGESQQDLEAAGASPWRSRGDAFPSPSPSEKATAQPPLPLVLRELYRHACCYLVFLGSVVYSCFVDRSVGGRRRRPLDGQNSSTETQTADCLVIPQKHENATFTGRQKEEHDAAGEPAARRLPPIPRIPCPPTLSCELPSCPVCLERLDVSVTGVWTRSEGWLQSALLAQSHLLSCPACQCAHSCPPGVESSPRWIPVPPASFARGSSGEEPEGGELDKTGFPGDGRQGWEHDKEQERFEGCTEDDHPRIHEHSGAEMQADESFVGSPPTLSNLRMQSGDDGGDGGESFDGHLCASPVSPSIITPMNRESPAPPSVSPALSQDGRSGCGHEDNFCRERGERECRSDVGPIRGPSVHSGRHPVEMTVTEERTRGALSLHQLSVETPGNLDMHGEEGSMEWRSDLAASFHHLPSPNADARAPASSLPGTPSAASFSRRCMSPGVALSSPLALPSRSCQPALLAGGECGTSPSPMLLPQQMMPIQGQAERERQGGEVTGGCALAGAGPLHVPSEIPDSGHLSPARPAPFFRQVLVPSPAPSEVSLSIDSQFGRQKAVQNPPTRSSHLTDLCTCHELRPLPSVSIAGVVFSPPPPHPGTVPADIQCPLHGSMRHSAEGRPQGRARTHAPTASWAPADDRSVHSAAAGVSLSVGFLPSLSFSSADMRSLPPLAPQHRAYGQRPQTPDPLLMHRQLQAHGRPPLSVSPYLGESLKNGRSSSFVSSPPDNKAGERKEGGPGTLSAVHTSPAASLRWARRRRISNAPLEIPPPRPATMRAGDAEASFDSRMESRGQVVGGGRQGVSRPHAVEGPEMSVDDFRKLTPSPSPSPPLSPPASSPCGSEPPERERFRERGRGRMPRTSLQSRRPCPSLDSVSVSGAVQAGRASNEGGGGGRPFQKPLQVQVVQQQQNAFKLEVQPAHAECPSCWETNQLWTCMVCGHVGCGRYASGHAKDHAENTRHWYCLHLSSGRIWDYQKDVFVHRRLVQSAAAGRTFDVRLPHPAAAPMQQQGDGSPPFPIPPAPALHLGDMVGGPLGGGEALVGVALPALPGELGGNVGQTKGADGVPVLSHYSQIPDGAAEGFPQKEKGGVQSTSTPPQLHGATEQEGAYAYGGSDPNEKVVHAPTDGQWDGGAGGGTSGVGNSGEFAAAAAEEKKLDEDGETDEAEKAGGSALRPGALGVPRGGEPDLMLELDVVLASQLEYQRHFFEVKMTEARRQHANWLAAREGEAASLESELQELRSRVSRAEKEKRKAEKAVTQAEAKTAAAKQEVDFVMEVTQAMAATRTALRTRAAAAAASASARASVQEPESAGPAPREVPVETGGKDGVEAEDAAGSGSASSTTQAAPHAAASASASSSTGPLVAVQADAAAGSPRAEGVTGSEAVGGKGQSTESSVEGLRDKGVLVEREKKDVEPAGASAGDPESAQGGGHEEKLRSSTNQGKGSEALRETEGGRDGAKPNVSSSAKGGKRQKGGGKSSRKDRDKEHRAKEKEKEREGGAAAGASGCSIDLDAGIGGVEADAERDGGVSMGTETVADQALRKREQLLDAQTERLQAKLSSLMTLL
uniref:UBP-type domain-containing protein n=1 Tax=Chromera velia CCMP2878 TaxID=1169474 RepID=A0A0G4G8X0_9ALVE|eukprot:Cvel_20790.t1-p1 / transcript=Cvel_20790.t1 / gene=Cvel_20790 / organism=Chromera_velia_CCMP2878 / gene_product=RING finger protein ETP1, putative / transcript_product=RING finger protein ETP1, putative / location=Cvel_scaffold1898:11225-19632(-) / protein_length=1752 / sequence_SO=supercontig / SO=protein_coding / is_pseudo=false